MTDLDNWPDCPIEGCTNKICLALDSKFCFPHTPGNEHVKRIDIDARRVIQGCDDDDWMLRAPAERRERPRPPCPCPTRPT